MRSRRETLLGFPCEHLCACCASECTRCGARDGFQRFCGSLGVHKLGKRKLRRHLWQHGGLESFSQAVAAKGAWPGSFLTTWPPNPGKRRLRKPPGQHGGLESFSQAVAAKGVWPGSFWTTWPPNLGKRKLRRPPGQHGGLECGYRAVLSGALRSRASREAFQCLPLPIKPHMCAP